MYKVSKNTKLISYVLMSIGILAVIQGFINDAHRAWPSLMVNNYFFLAISAFAIFFITLQYVSEAAWAIPFKRVAEAITSYFLIGGVIMLLIIIAENYIGIIFGIGWLMELWIQIINIMIP